MEHPYLKRQLKAILLADVVGYSRLMSIDEEGTHVRIANYAKDLIEPKIAEHRGRLIRTMGDGFLVEFDSAADAVSCGLDIQGQLETHETAADKDRRIRLRIGINTGDVITDDRDIYGNSVNIAARLEGLAEPGEIYVTRGVRDHLEGHPGLAFEDRGERRVKNIKNPIRVYRVKHVQGRPGRSSRYLTALGRRFSPAGFRFETRATVLSTVILATVVTVGVAGLPAWRDQSRVVPRASIVVMPFNNLSNDPGQDYFADAITDDLTTDLSRLPGTFVIARGTAFTYKGRAVDARQIGQECGVRYLLEGSINRVDARLQTNARLIDTASATQIWADRFDNEVGDLVELERTVTGRIASSLGIELVKAEGRRAMDEQAPNPDATDLRVRGMSLYFGSITPEHSQGNCSPS
jgi:class 3 adenylate cyclase